MASYTITGCEGFSPVSVKLTRCVNPHTELQPGGVCPGLLELTGYGTEDFSLPAGRELTLYRDGVKLGIYIAEKPRFRSGLWHITAYDRLSLLEVQLGQWLYELPDWPYTLQSLVDKVLQRCGITAANSLPRMQELPVSAFAARGITGRQIIQWACQIAGCFCRATAEGLAEFGWFIPTQKAVTPTGEHFTYMDGFTAADYEVMPIEKVQLRRTATDIGAVYPDQAGEKNTLVIEGNYLLTGQSAEQLETAAQSLYEHMKDCIYTPAQVVSVPLLEPGDIFTVTDTRGKTHTLYAMTVTEEDGVQTTACTGAYRRDDSAAVNTARYESITGRVLELQADVEGLRVENRSARGDMAALELAVEGISATVMSQQTQNDRLEQSISTVQQQAGSLTLELETLVKNGTSSVTTATGYTFDDEGLKIQKSGQEMENLLDNTGMYVKRSGDVILQANAAGVQATDVTVRNYLIIGTHARLEDYPTGRTACFYLAGSAG